MSGKQKNVRLCEQPDKMTPSEILSQGWSLIEAIFDLKGLEIPLFIYFQIDGQNQIRPTRVATLDELETAIAALDNAIEQFNQSGTCIPDYLMCDSIVRLKATKNTLLELKRQASRSGCPTSTTVIEALFPDVPVKKKTAAEVAEIDRWLETIREEALKIAPDTAEVMWDYAHDLDPYCVLDEWELPEEFRQVGRAYFARAPGSDVWVEFGDLPDAVRGALWKRHRRQLVFPAGLEVPHFT
jgi:hypothetical protein